ncbi:uncharacterized protein LOC135389485 [Ornithodoros turicata]|uniref:uncharacterized protein LOC135389485 n=1 Tax=Ornithodoros turicata TaxID=34597 RepID=UPI003139C381
MSEEEERASTAATDDFGALHEDDEDLASAMSNCATQCTDHNYGLRPEASDDPRKVLLQQRSTIEDLIEKEKELQGLLEEKNAQLAALQVECHRKEGEVSHRDLQLIKERQRNQWLQTQLRAAYQIVQEAEERSTENCLSYNALTKNEKDLQYYAGFASVALLQNLYAILEPDVKHLQFWQMKRAAGTEEERRFVVSLEDQFIMTLVRLRHGLDGADLARRYQVSKSTVSRIWTTWIDFLFNRLIQIPIWMSSELCDKYRPAVFQEKGYSTVDGILDCTEIFIEKPSSYRVQSETYSLYKKANTAKGLVVCSPNVFVTFASDLVPGMKSDKELTLESGVLKQFEKGRAIMADRGFLIDKECEQESLILNRPPFLKGKPQLSVTEEAETRRIASLRIHFERVIGRIKSFKILSHVFPNSMSQEVNKVWHVCARLVNFVDRPFLSRSC